MTTDSDAAAPILLWKETDMADGPNEHPRIRYIDIRGLPEGYDAADLLEQSPDPAQALQWLKERVREFDETKGIPAPIAAVPDKPKPAAPPEDASGSGSAPQPVPPKGKGKPTRNRSNDEPPPEATNVVALRKPQEETDTTVPPEYSDDRLASEFAERYHDRLAYVPNWARWMVWDGSRWSGDETLIAKDLARRVCRKRAAEATRRVEEFKSKAATIATKLSSLNTITNVENLAKSDRKIVATASQWDSEPWVLNTPAGIVDLRTGQMRPGRREDFCSKATKVAPSNAPATRWREFLKVATGGDVELESFLQRMAGYCLTGDCREQVFFFFHGKGGNGKGTFLNTLSWLYADYAAVADIELFTEQRFRTNTAGVAMLHGARLVTSQEVREGARWDQQKITAYTGADPITAEFKYQNPFTYIPQFKLLFAGNNKPSLRTVDDAIKRRLLLVPFTVMPPKPDPTLPARLQDEAGAILAWAIEGCLQWCDRAAAGGGRGLEPPARVLATTKEYFDDEDLMGIFIADCIAPEPMGQLPVADVYRAFDSWLSARGEQPIPMRRFADRMELHGYKPVKRSAMVYLGIGLASKTTFRRGDLL